MVALLEDEMRVTDLDDFSLQQVWRPYQGMVGYERRLDRPALPLDATADRLRQDTAWTKCVLDRLRGIGVEFPAYVQHPLVDVIVERAGGRRLCDGVKRIDDARKDAERLSEERRVLWREAMSDAVAKGRQLAAAREALRKYGDHIPRCAAKHKDEPCTCGFTAALSDAPAPVSEITLIEQMLDEGQGDDDGPPILPKFEPGMSIVAKVESCLHLLEKRRDVIAAQEGADWRDDPSADERWNAGCDYAMTQLCAVLKVDPQSVNWDAATETLDGDVQSVLHGILAARAALSDAPAPKGQSDD